MKISIGAVIALMAASASGFSITMSSYLDNLASTATLTSFSSGGGPATAYAPAPSYAAPAAPAAPAFNGASNSAPAPAPYQSSLAGQPASTTINYIGTIGGGSQMKSGPNFTGMSQAFRPSASSGNSAYLDNIKANGAAAPVNGATAPANGAFAQASAPATPRSSNPAPAPYQGASSSAPASTALNYIGTIGGGSQMKAGPNYTGMSQSFRPSASTGNSAYLDNIKANGASAPSNGAFAQASAPAAPYQSSNPAPAPYQGASAGSPASTSLNYIGTIGGGSQMKSGPNYTGMSASFKSTSSVGPSSYLENIKGVSANGASAPANGAFAQAPAPYQSSAPAPAPYQGSSAGTPASSSLNYIGTIGGGSQMKSGPNYTGMSTSFKSAPSVGNSAYLENVAGASVASFANGAAAPANGAYASSPAPAPQSSFTPGPAPAGSAPAPFGGRNSYMPQPSGRVVNTGIGNYLDALK